MATRRITAITHRIPIHKPIKSRVNGGGDASKDYEGSNSDTKKNQ